MVQHQPFDNMFTEIHGLFIRGRYHHAVPGIDHTAHLHAFDRTLQKFYRTYPTGPDRPQGRVIAKPRNHDAQFFGGINHLGPCGNFYFLFVDNQFRHEKPLTIDDCQLMLPSPLTSNLLTFSPSYLLIFRPLPLYALCPLPLSSFLFPIHYLLFTIHCSLFSIHF